MGISQNYGYLFGGPHNRDYSILGSILGFPYFGKLPYHDMIYYILVEYIILYYNILYYGTLYDNIVQYIILWYNLLQYRVQAPWRWLWARRAEDAAIEPPPEAPAETTKAAVICLAGS